MRRKRKSRLAAAEFIGILTVRRSFSSRPGHTPEHGADMTLWAASFLLLLLPIIYYLLKQTIRDYVRDFVELYENAPED